MRLVTDGSSLDEASHDSGIVTLRPQAVCWADGESEVLEALKLAESRGLSVALRGGGTSIPSQSIGLGMVLMQNSTRMNEVEGMVLASPSVVKADLNSFLGQRSAWMPVDPSSYRSCTIGGMVANNSSGIRTPKYGSTIDYVAGLRAVVPGDAASHFGPVATEEALSGDSRTKKVASLILDNMKEIREEVPRVTKNSSGYRLERVVSEGMVDFSKLLVGSEGTLGVVTEVAFRTEKPQSWKILLVIESSLADLGRTAEACRRLHPSAIELVDKSIFRRVGREDRVRKYSRSEEDFMIFSELDGHEGDQSETLEELAMSEVAELDPLVLTASSEISAAWDVRNETLTMALEIRREGRTMLPGVEDLVVPPERLGDLVRLLSDQFGRRGLESISYGHAGDANLHARPLLDKDSPKDRRTLEDLMAECFEGVWNMGGSMTGEHGDGMLRGPFVEKQYPHTYWIMKEVRKAFDPRGLLSPGVKIV